jgi:hypothetical protein
MSKELTPEQVQLLTSIETLLADAENAITLPMTAINQGIAKLSQESSKSVVSIQNKLLKSIQAHAVANDNEIDQLGMAILAPLQTWQEENNLLLTQLAAYSGLTQPGDPLEAALLTEVAQEPELAYSATLLLAIREAMPYFRQLVEVLKEIRDRMPGIPVEFPGEPPASAASQKAVIPQKTFTLPQALPGDW